MMVCVPAFAASNYNGENNNRIDYYAEEKAETVNLKGVNYTYHYSYSSEGNKTIKITYQGGNKTDILTYDVLSSTIYLNNSVLGKVDTESILRNGAVKSSDPNWIYFNSTSQRISWAMGTTIAVVAGAMAIVLGSCGGVGYIIAAVGSGTLGILAASAIGGTIHQTIYQFNSPFVTQFRDDWSFTASTGDSYGPYTYMFE